MSRHYLGISARGSTVFRNVRKDETGEPLLLIDENAVVKLTIDFSDWLESAETLSTLTAVGRSCTVAVSGSGSSRVLTISAVTSSHDGDITVIATASTGEIYREIIRVRRTNRYTDEALVFGDYV